jgi:hypothetical protein
MNANDYIFSASATPPTFVLLAHIFISQRNSALHALIRFANHAPARHGDIRKREDKGLPACFHPSLHQP